MDLTTRKNRGERSKHLIGYHVKYISFSKKMYKYLDITKPDNGMRININITIDKCKFEPRSGEVYMTCGRSVVFTGYSCFLHQ